MQWRHNGCDIVLNHQRLDCLPNRLFRRRSKKTSRPDVTGLCEGNSRVAGEFPSQRDSNAENVSISWRHHEIIVTSLCGNVFRITAPVWGMPCQKQFSCKFIPGDIALGNRMCIPYQSLTHRCRMTHICASKLGPHWFRWRLVACRSSSYYRNQWWLNVNQTPANTFNDIWIKSPTSMIQENQFQNILSLDYRSPTFVIYFAS